MRKRIKNIHISIDHDESDSLEGYRGVVLRERGMVMARHYSGRPIVDWWTAFREAVATGDRLIFASSVDHFLHDVPGYRMIEWHGVEVLVGDPRDRELDAVEADWTENLSAGRVPAGIAPDGSVGSWASP